MLKRIRAKLKCALEANVLHFSKRASGITKNASVTAERAHAWRQAVRGYGDEENDERGPGNVDSVLNVFKAMSDVLMAIVSVDSKCSDDDSDDESEIVKKYSPFASQLRALSTKAF
jgi:predicted amino acid racemase